MVILTTGLNRILEINSDDLYAVVEPGVITAQFAAAVAKNLFYPPDPGSGGVHHRRQYIAGKRRRFARLKYGVTKDYLRRVEFLIPTGALVKSGLRTVKVRHGLAI